MVEPSAAARGWPFLVARGRRKGYRVLLVPDLLADSNQHGLLAEALSGGSAPPGLPQVESVSAAGIGPICCAYQTERLGGYASGGPPEEPMLDEHGRPLEILYGLACPTDGVLDPNAADLDLARAAALATYHRFLADEAGFTPERSHPFVVRSRISARPAGIPAPTAPEQWEQFRPGPPDLVALPPPPRARRSSGQGLAAAAVGVLGVALAGTVWALLLRSPEVASPPAGEVVSVQVQEPKVDDIECGRSETIRVDAVVATDGEARVTFHWEDPSTDFESDPIEVRFDKEGSEEVHVSRSVRIPAGFALRGSTSLVVEAPNRVTDTVDYVLRCERSVRIP